MSYYINYETMGKNRWCLDNCEYPHNYTDKWFRVHGVGSKSNYIKLAEMLVDMNPGYELPHKIMKTINKQYDKITYKQYKVLRNYVDTCIRLSYSNFPIWENVKKKFFNNEKMDLTLLESTEKIYYQELEKAYNEES